MIDVSVIIVNYNSFHLLDECLDSLFHFNKEISFEVIVVDNNSTVGDVESITSKYPAVRLIKNDKNIGFAAANNLALKIIKGKYTLFLNNDTVFKNNVIEKVFDFAEAMKQPVFAGCQLLNADMTKQESVVDFPNLWNTITENIFLYKIFKRSKIFNKYYQNNYNYSEPQEVDVIKGAFMFCETATLKKLNGFDDRFFFYSEETDLCYRFKKSGGKIFFLPYVKLIHYGGETTDKNLWFKYKNQTTGKIQYYQKHFYGIRFTAVIFIHFTGLFLRGILFSVSGIFLLKKNIMKKGYYFFKQMFVYPQNKFVT